MIEPTWEEIEEICENLAQQIKSCPIEFKAIYPIARGGYIPAVILSHKLNIRMVGDIYNPYNEPILVVDDINDTGRSIRPFLQDKGYHVAVLYERTSSQEAAHFFGEIVSNKLWICFPWENKNKAKEDQQKYRESRNAIH
jgi:hypoxanthine phosphoribosyltransferase